MSDPIHFEILPPVGQQKPRKWPKPNVAADRYRKQIYEADADRAGEQFTKAGLSGAAISALVKKPAMKLGKAAAIGTGAGIAAQALVRSVTKHHRDRFGERRHGAKRADGTLPLAGEVVAAGLGYRKIAGKVGRVAVKFASLRKDGIQFSALDAVKKILGSKLARNTAWGAGALGTAGALSGAIVPDKDHTHTESAISGAVKDGIFGGALYGATEPLLKKALRLAAKVRLVRFGGAQQMRGQGKRFVDPLDVASGTTKAYHTDEHGNESEVHVGVRHAQVVRAALNKGRSIHRYGKRVGALGSDAVGALAGRTKVDERGRPVKREWEKSWFKNAVGTAAVAGGLLTHAHIMKRNPAYRAKVQGAVVGAKKRMNRVVPDLFPLPKDLAAKVRLLCFRAQQRAIHFDMPASMAGWDVRDPRGRSARVFAPGSRRRERREKQWHERVDNIRKVAVIGSAAALAGGGLLGWKLAKRSAAKSVIRPRAGEAFVPTVVPRALSALTALVRFAEADGKKKRVAGLAIAAAGAAALPSAVPMLKIMGRRLGGRKSASDAGRFVSDYLNSAHRALNTGLHGKIAGSVIQHARASTTPNTMGRFMTDHYARFRAGHREALRHWGYEVGESMHQGAVKRGMSHEAATKRMEPFLKGQTKTHAAIDEQLHHHGKNEAEAIAHVGQSADPEIQNFFRRLQVHKAMAVKTHYGPLATTAPAAIAGGAALYAGGRRKKDA